MRQIEIQRTPTADEQALRESGLLTFCHRQLAKADRKFK